MNDDISISAKSAGLNEQSYISELRDAYENSVRAITSTEIWFSLIYSNSYCDADICGLLKERDSLRAQLAEKDKEIDAADAALTHVVDCMKNPNNRGSKTLLQTCRFFDDLINTAIKIRARIV